MKNWKGLKKIIAGLLTVSLLFTSMNIEKVQGATADPNVAVSFNKSTYGTVDIYNGASRYDRLLQVRVYIDGSLYKIVSPNTSDSRQFTKFSDSAVNMSFTFDESKYVFEKVMSNECYVSAEQKSGEKVQYWQVENNNYTKYQAYVTKSSNTRTVSLGLGQKDKNNSYCSVAEIYLLSKNSSPVYVSKYAQYENVFKIPSQYNSSAKDAIDWTTILDGSNALNLSKTDTLNSSIMTQVGLSINDYEYSCVKINDKDNGVKATYIKCVEGKYYYTVSKEITSDTIWSEVENNNILIILTTRDRLAKANKSKVDTIDTRGIINISTFNYDNTSNSTTINSSSHKLYFWDDATNGTKGSVNKWTGGSSIYSYVEKTLDSNGYPKMNCTSPTTTESLQYLFDVNTSDVGVNTIVEDASYLFTYDDSTKRYLFDSSIYNAALDVNSGDFSVYNDAGQNFFPYSRENLNYATDKFSFGMHVDFNFIQPKNGIFNNEDMIFEFSGDDDVWVYIDGVLVLDLGGIHSKATGSINFATGEVMVNGNHYSYISDCYSSAGVDTSIISKYFENDSSKTYKNFTSHNIDIFYMERGASESNCKIQFNLPVIATDSLYVTKEVLSSDGVDIDEEAEYSFNLYKSGVLVKNESFKILENGVSTGKTGTVDANGVFKLKDGQTAEFENIDDGTKYVVKEINIPTDCSVYFGNQLQQTVDGTVSTSEETFKVGTANVTTFRNVFVSTKKDYSKTAVVDSVGDRTFEIELKADISSQTVDVSDDVIKTPVDVVLVLDGSRSMYYQGDLTFLKQTTLSDLRSTNSDDIKNGKIYIYNASGDPYQVMWNKGSYGDMKNKYYCITSLGGYMEMNENSTYSFYYSASAGKYTRQNAVLDAVKETLDSLAKIGDCNVAVTMFSGDAGKHLLMASAVTESNKESLLTTITSSYSLTGGTYPSWGLDLAYDALVNYNDYPYQYTSYNYNNDIISKSTNAKYVVLLTDGCPSRTSEIDESIEYADNIKDTGAKIYTIGLDMDNTLSTKINGNYTVENFLTDLSSGENYVKSSSSNELSGLFSSLIQEIKKENYTTVYVSGEVRDYIDPNFEVVTKTGSEYVVAKNGDKINGGTLHISESETYISWDTQELKEFDKKILVRAKASFFGGNVVYTNENKSGIYIDGKIKYVFEQPLVNVPILNITGSEDEETVYIQDEVVPKSYFENSNSLFTGIPSQSMISTDEILTLINSGDSVEKSYLNYDGTVLGKFVYMYTANKTADKHVVTEVGFHKEFYDIDVTFVPSTVAERLTSLEKKADTIVADSTTLVKDDVTISAKYYINVVEGQINIVKKLADNTTYSKDYEGDPIFTFRIDKYSDAAHTNRVATYYRTVRFDETGIKTIEAETISGLGRGYYVVTELATQRYENDNKANRVEINFGDADLKDMGQLNDKSSLVINKGATVTNSKKGETGKQTDTDVVMNRYEKDENGVWHVVAVTVPQKTQKESQKSKETVNREYALLPTKSEKQEGNN